MSAAGPDDIGDLAEVATDSSAATVPEAKLKVTALPNEPKLSVSVPPPPRIFPVTPLPELKVNVSLVVPPVRLPTLEKLNLGPEGIMKPFRSKPVPGPVNVQVCPPLLLSEINVVPMASEVPSRVLKFANPPLKPGVEVRG